MNLKDRKELHLKSIKELINQAREAKDALSNLKLDKTQNKLKNTSLLFIKRREIAQILTIIRGKELSDKAKKV